MSPQSNQAWPTLGTGAGSRMAVVIIIIQEITVIGEMGPRFGFLFHPSQRGGGRVLLSWRYSFGSHVLLGFCILVLHSGKNNFCHFNISLCCMKSQLWPSVVHEELAALDAKSWENLLISEEKMLRRTQSAFKVSFPRSELN